VFKIYFNNILSYHVRVHIQIGLVLFAFRLNISKHFSSTHACYMSYPYRPVRVSDINSYIIPFNCCSLLRSRSLSLTIVGIGEGNLEGFSVSTMYTNAIEQSRSGESKFPGSQETMTELKTSVRSGDSNSFQVVKKL
jgi:hypothetical protein